MINLQKDLDAILQQNREYLRKTMSADLENQFEDVSIGRILFEITEEARTLKDIANTIEQRAVVIETTRLMDNKRIELARRIDARMKQSNIYSRYVRPQIVNCAKNILCRKSVSAKDLLQYDGVTFIDACYVNILKRYPEEEARTNGCRVLRRGDQTKAEFLNQILQSEEAALRPVKVRWIKVYLWRDKTRRVLRSLPVIGNIVRWMSCLVLLVQRMDFLFKVTKELCETRDVHEWRLAQFSKQLEELQEKVNQLASSTETHMEQVAVLKSSATEMHNLISELQGESSAQKDMMNELYSERTSRVKLMEQQNLKAEKLKERLDELYLHYGKMVLNSKKDYADTHAQFFDRLEMWVGDREKSALSVVDLGCGEGGWISHLSELGYCCTGVDSNPHMLAQVEGINTGLTLCCEDAISFLRRQELESWDVISSFHMVEHLELEELVEFFDLCKNALKPNGLLILVTPNPKNILVATETFHMDPTHKKVIPLELLQFYMREWGLEVIDTISHFPMSYFPMEYKDDPVSHMAFRFNVEMEYSIWAVKKQ